MTQKERMDKGLIYDCGNSEIFKEQLTYLDDLYEFNLTRPRELAKRQVLLHKMFGGVGEGCFIEPPMHANWGCHNVFLGDYVYANTNLTLVDDGKIYIGDKVMIGPNVTLATANHPICPELRARGLQYNKDIHIGNNVWLGAGVVVVPGVTIGDNSVIGAGSIVTKDIPAGVVAVGNPCRVLREIGEHDSEYFYKDEKIDYENLKDILG